MQQNVGNSVLLSVHGVQPPGEEITVELTSVLQRRLNQRTLEEIQTALLKNAHIRLEASDIKVGSNNFPASARNKFQFIQQDPQQPSCVFYLTVPAVMQGYLASLEYYFRQQLSTFCIQPHFREQSEAATGSGRASVSPAAFISTEENPTHVPYGTSFTPYLADVDPPNPSDYTPSFHLLNKPPGEGRRGTGETRFATRATVD